jgi:hypothetical protein
MRISINQMDLELSVYLKHFACLELSEHIDPYIFKFIT